MPDCIGCGLEVEGGLLKIKLDPADHIFCDSSAGVTNGLFYTNSQTAFISNSETTTSGTFTDLATVGPSVSIQTGTIALVLFGTELDTSDDSFGAYMSVAVSGATTIVASVTYAVSSFFQENFLTLSYGVLLTVNAGSNTFTAKYATDSGATGTFRNRRITVIA
jgi:hypothetical protein